MTQQSENANGTDFKLSHPKTVRRAKYVAAIFILDWGIGISCGIWIWYTGGI